MLNATLLGEYVRLRTRRAFEWGGIEELPVSHMLACEVAPRRTELIQSACFARCRTGASCSSGVSSTQGPWPRLRGSAPDGSCC
jgi:hypothetical protein